MGYSRKGGWSNTSFVSGSPNTGPAVKATLALRRMFSHELGLCTNLVYIS